LTNCSRKDGRSRAMRAAMIIVIADPVPPPGRKRACPVRRPLRRDARSAHNRQLLRAAVRPGVTHRASVGLPFSCSQPGIHGETVAAWGVGDRRRRAGSSARTAASRTAARPELLVPLPVVVLGDAPVSLQYVGSWHLSCQIRFEKRKSVPQRCVLTIARVKKGKAGES
jgi:hypothetical protein